MNYCIILRKRQSTKMNDYEKLFDQVTEVLKSKEVPRKQAEFARAMFEAYVEQGFTEDQAIELLKSKEPIQIDAELQFTLWKLIL